MYIFIFVKYLLVFISHFILVKFSFGGVARTYDHVNASCICKIILKEKFGFIFKLYVKVVHYAFKHTKLGVL